MISTATVIAFVCVFTFFKSQSVSENALVRGIIGFTQSTLSMSKRFTIAFWSTILYMRKLEVFVFEMILGPFTFIIVSIQLLLYFDYVWQFYFLFSICQKMNKFISLKKKRIWEVRRGINITNILRAAFSTKVLYPAFLHFIFVFFVENKFL